MGRSRLVFVAALAALLAACAPFQRGTTGGTASNPGAAALIAAESRIGAPYRYGGAGPDAFDCSGLVAYSYRQAGITLPRTAAQQYAAVTPVPKRDLKPGDLVFFRVNGNGVSHVGIYAGDDRLVDAPQTGGRVRMVRLDDEWYRERYVGAGRPYRN
jgi:cell wall-associated NlpC family hydrolase